LRARKVRTGPKQFRGRILIGMADPLLSCFYYTGHGERCGVTCPSPVTFCATHMVQMQRRPAKDLFRQAAAALLASTTFNESGLPVLTCRDFEQWGLLANSLTGLWLHGYRDDDVLLTLLLGSLLAVDSPWRNELKLPAKSKTFEILVARLYLQELAALLKARQTGQLPGPTEAVRVLWDQKVESSVTSGKRQIDVLIRWYRGPMSDVFTAVECKDTEVEISDVEAFATKLKTVGANNGVMASSVGFQTGAVETAKAFGITLRVIKEEDLAVDTVIDWRYLFTLRHGQIFLEPPDGREATPLVPPGTQYKIKEGPVITGIVERIEQILESAVPVLGEWPPAIEQAMDGAQLLFDDGRTEPLAKIFIPLTLEQRLKQVTIETPRRPRAFSISEIVPPAQRRVAAESVPLRLPPQMEAGQFYANFFCQSYYCTAVSDKEIRFVLLADKQHGQVIDVEGSQLPEYAHHYYRIEDPIALKRLQSDLERFKQLPGSPGVPPISE